MRTLLLPVALALFVPAIQGQSFLGKREAAWLKELQEGQGKDRRSAAFALGKLGPVSDNVLAALVTALKDRDAAVRDAAAFALGEIAEGREADRVQRRAGQELLARLTDDDARVR